MATQRYTPKAQSLETIGTLPYLIYLFLIPIFIAIVVALASQEFILMGLSLINFGLFWLAAKLTHLGVIQEYRIKKASLFIPSKVPHKTLATILIATGTYVSASVVGGLDWSNGLGLAIVSGVGYVMYYGFDTKLTPTFDTGDVSLDVIITSLREAKTKLSSIKTNTAKIADFTLRNKIQQAIGKSENIINKIESQPKIIRNARKFLVVYIDGIDSVIKSYLELEHIDKKTDENLLSLMDDIDKKFDDEIYRLSQNDAIELDVNIEVLKQQINN